MHSNTDFVVEHAIRRKIRTKILEALEKKRKDEREALEERKFRELVREVIKESVSQSASPHDSTGINTLEDLLRSVIPTLEAAYKRLTTSHEQRQSFRAHIINAAENALAPVDANSEKPRPGMPEPNIGDEGGNAVDIEKEKPKNFSPDEISPKDGEVPSMDPLKENQALYEEDPADMGKFIDINAKPEKETEEEVKDPVEEFGMDGFELTGRNFAYSTYKKIDTQIKDAYKLLGSPEDKEIFFDYLITNLKLYFDRFEEELTPNVKEPTTPEYQAQVGKQLGKNDIMEDNIVNGITERIIDYIKNRI